MIKNIMMLLCPPLRRLCEERDHLQEERDRYREKRDRLRDERDRILAQWRAQPILAILSQMTQQRVDLVLEVGANKGAFAQSLRSAGYTGQIISIEPLSAAFAVLQDKCAQDGNWDCHKLAIGEADAETTINVSANSYSSSLLPVRARTLEIEPRIGYVAEETVVLRRLDSLLPKVTEAQRIFLKIDAQGSEGKVIEGGRSIFDRIAMVQMELAWTPSYEGQAEMGEMVDVMRELGLEPGSVAPSWTDKATGLMPEIDVTFFRPPPREARPSG
ncbi:MAG TPA: FkbM family methyltransferase [Rhizomicrobium sp.]|nr:FkbM family methyltransferase [Rhizomicrobium sp.]